VRSRSENLTQFAVRRLPYIRVLESNSTVVRDFLILEIREIETLLAREEAVSTCE